MTACGQLRAMLETKRTIEVLAPELRRGVDIEMARHMAECGVCSRPYLESSRRASAEAAAAQRRQGARA